MRWTLVAAVVVLAAAAVSGQQPEAERELRQLAADVQSAKLRGDAAFLERVWTADFTYTTSRGELRTREQGLADYRGGGVRWMARDIDDMRVRLSGDVAVVTARLKVRGTVRGQERAEEDRLTDVYVRRAGGGAPSGSGSWRLFAAHESRIAP